MSGFISNKILREPLRFTSQLKVDRSLNLLDVDVEDFRPPIRNPIDAIRARNVAKSLYDVRHALESDVHDVRTPSVRFASGINFEKKKQPRTAGILQKWHLLNFQICRGLVGKIANVEVDTERYDPVLVEFEDAPSDDSDQFELETCD